jgi:hypothetical protein
MVKALTAQASPEKRLFISLLTRDIPLVAAFLDLLDNSINAAVEPSAHRLETAQGYMDLFQDATVTPAVAVHLEVSSGKVEIRDTASGISAKTAENHVFKFGRPAGEAHAGDRLSVYGIGLKRAMFKLGNKIQMRSDHTEGGFELDLDVAQWEKATELPWTFTLTPREPAKPDACGTTITVTELYDDVSRRIDDGVFLGQLRDAISQTYAFYMSKFVTIQVNDEPITGAVIEVGSNHASENLAFDDVTIAITAGIGKPEGGQYREKNSGWFIFCNGRVVIAADKGFLSGWGTGSGLPIFQPKHRPFLGTVFFVSPNVEHLPWTTTKAAINEESLVWQNARRRMIALGRIVVSFLDGRYTEEGAEIASKELQDATGGNSVSVLSAAVSQKRAFEIPKAPKPTTTKIQYDAKLKDVDLIKSYLKRYSMSGSELGRYTFDYFLRNEVGE